MFRILLILSSFLFTTIAVADEVKIGVQAPITGKFASEGRGINNAVRLLVSEINAKGGINGDTFVVLTCDDEASPQKAVICAKKLINDDVKVVIGSYTSTATEASQSLYARAFVIQTSEATSANLMKRKYPNYFRNSFNDNVEGEFTANYFVNIKKYKRIAILSDYSAFASGLSQAVADNIKKMDGNIVYQGKINANNQDFKAILTDIKSKEPDVIYYSGYYPEGALLRLQQLELGIKADFIGGNANDNPEYLNIAGKAAVGSYLIGLPLPSQLNTELVKNFVKNYEETYQSPIPSIWTITNADGLLVIMNAMKATKSNDPIIVAKYIHGSIKDMPALSGTITIREDGERVGYLYQVSEINSKMQYTVKHK